VKISLIKAVLFDLDDTLYEESDFVRSGFTAVAGVLQAREVPGAATAVSLLEKFHHLESRSGVFQKLAAQLEFPAAWIPDLVSVYRSHRPVIQLAEDAIEVLPRLRKSFRLGCVTDGWADVQRRKIKALGLEEMLDAIVVADDHGREFWKPHARPFLACCQQLGISPSEAVYVGDNLERDWVGARGCKMPFVWLRRVNSYFSGQRAPAQDLNPEVQVKDLWELEHWLS
jgi:putative hydrolase of the HAD superfamily